MNRRGFLAALAGLPLVGWLVPKPKRPDPNANYETLDHYLATTTSTSSAQPIEVSWTTQTRVRGLLTPENHGWSGCIATLPGVVSQGDTLKEAARHLGFALEDVLQSYADAGQSPPWANAAPGECEWMSVRRDYEVHSYLDYEVHSYSKDGHTTWWVMPPEEVPWA